MSEQNPFKIISPSEEVPEGLKSEVMGSVKLLMLSMRLVQLFLGDYAHILFDKVRLLSPKEDTKETNNSSD